MKRLLPFSLAITGGLLVGTRSPAVSCPDCPPYALDLLYRGTYLSDDPTRLEILDGWGNLRLVPLDSNEKPTEFQVISISVGG